MRSLVSGRELRLLDDEEWKNKLKVHFKAIFNRQTKSTVTDAFGEILDRLVRDTVPGSPSSHTSSRNSETDGRITRPADLTKFLTKLSRHWRKTIAGTLSYFHFPTTCSILAASPSLFGKK